MVGRFFHGWGKVDQHRVTESTVATRGATLCASWLLSLVSQWLFQFPLAYVLSKHTDLIERGIWYSFAVTNELIALVAIAWFARGSGK